MIGIISAQIRVFGLALLYTVWTPQHDLSKTYRLSCMYFNLEPYDRKKMSNEEPNEKNLKAEMALDEGELLKCTLFNTSPFQV